MNNSPTFKQKIRALVLPGIITWAIIFALLMAFNSSDWLSKLAIAGLATVFTMIAMTTFEGDHTSNGEMP